MTSAPVEQPRRGPIDKCWNKMRLLLFENPERLRQAFDEGLRRLESGVDLTSADLRLSFRNSSPYEARKGVWRVIQIAIDTKR